MFHSHEINSFIQVYGLRKSFMLQTENRNTILLIHIIQIAFEIEPMGFIHFFIKPKVKKKKKS